MTSNRVVVSGGASGLGAAVVSSLLADGASPFVLDVREPRAGVPFAIVDVSHHEQVSAGVQAAATALGGIDGVVTAAGIDQCGGILELSSDDWDDVIGVNLIGTVNVIRAALPCLLETHGRVVTVSSILALRPIAETTAYSASKAGVLGLTRALAAEFKGRIGVTSLIPGGMDTTFSHGRDPKYQHGPHADLCNPADVARMVTVALSNPAGCEVREIIVTPATDACWP
jgi:2-dehydro-3-deoxy-L-rhamnonate dehydrogenase (NAD+)